MEKSTFGISFKDGATVVPDDIKKAVQDAGFSVASLKLTASFSNTPVENDAHITIGNNAFHFVDVPKQTLNGDRVLTIVDKNFISAKEHKKYAQFTKMKCYETGTMASCCPKDKNTGTRIYHVTL